MKITKNRLAMSKRSSLVKNLRNYRLKIWE